MHTSTRRAGVAIICAIVASAGALHPAVTQAEPLDGNLSSGTFSNEAGTLGYELYVPASHTPEKKLPLVVALHGCTQTASAFRKLSRFDEVAASKGFIVVYPDQPKESNQLKCWNWFQDKHSLRGGGEPSMVAGITLQVAAQYNVDPARIYVTGLSAGGAMSTVMANTYPDLYAAFAVGSGCSYAAGAACAGYKSADPEVTGKKAYDAMGAFARPIPFIVFTGDQDKTVPPANADQLVRSQQVASDYADDGSKNGSVPSAPASTTTGRSEGGRSYTVRKYADKTKHQLGEYWVVNGMGHAWSGGDPAAQYADAAGPHESAAMWDFFASHPLGDAGPELGGGGPTIPGGWPQAPSGWPKPPTSWPSSQNPAWPFWPKKRP